MCVCVDCACPTGDWPPCDRPVLTEPARVPLLARCRTGAAAAGHLHSHALLPWDALVLPRRLYMSREGEQVGARVALQNGLAESLEAGAAPSYVPWVRERHSSSHVRRGMAIRWLPLQAKPWLNKM